MNQTHRLSYITEYTVLMQILPAN